MRTNSSSLAAVVLAISLSALLPTATASNPNPYGDPHSGAYLGVMADDLTPEKMAALKLTQPGGALVVDVDQDSPACKAGLQRNDVIVSVNGKKIEGLRQLQTLMLTSTPGKEAAITVVRNGTSQDIKVVLGSRRPLVATHVPEMPGPYAEGPMGPVGPVAAPGRPLPPGPVAVPDVMLPTFIPAAARHGLTVESLSSGLAAHFGVQPGRGVLVRSVQKGSPAASAGVKPGDVIVTVNNDEIHDIADWRRNMRTPAGKMLLGIVRDKREQTIQVSLPGPTDGSALRPEDWGEFDGNFDALNRQMERLGPEMQRRSKEIQHAMVLKQKELEHMHRAIEKSMKEMEPQLKNQTREIQKSMKELEPELKKRSEEVQKQMDRMRPELQKQMAELQQQLKLSQEDMDRIHHDVAEAMKAITPEIQQQMDKLKKEMEQHKFDMQDLMKDWPQDGERPNEF